MTLVQNRFGSLLALLSLLLPVACSNGTEHRDPPLDGTLSLTLKGRVVTPATLVGGGIVAAALFEDGTTVDLIEVTTNPSGGFSFELDQYNAEYPLLICTTGNSKYKDAWTGEFVALDGHPRLCAAYTASTALNNEVLIIDAWSTLAVALARGYRTHGQTLGITTTDWASLLSLAEERLAQHVAADTPPEIGFTAPANPSQETLQLPSARTGSGLSAAALATIAAQWPAAPGESVGAMALLEALCFDARDGLIDGLQLVDGSKQPVSLGGSDLTDQVLRYDLAVAIHALLTEREVTFAADVDAIAQFNAANGWYQRLSLAEGPLFPNNAGPLFDPVGPTINFGPDFPAADALVTEAAVLSVAFEGYDPHGMESLQVLEPEEYAAIEATLGDAGRTATLAFELDLESLQGPVLFRLLAKDLQGNETEADRLFTVALESPVIVELVPPAGSCVGSPSEELLVFAGHQGFVDIEVTLKDADGEIECSLKPDGYYHCAGPFEDGYQGTVVITDAYGREVTGEWELCVDGTPPVVAFEPESGTWRGPESSPEITVLMQDEHQVGVAEVLVNGEAVEVNAQKSKFTLALPAMEAVVDVTLEDIAGLFGEGQATYPWDDVPPLIESPELGIITNNFDYITHTFQVTDEGAGLAKVKLVGGEGIWNLQFDEDNYLLIGTVDPQPGVPPHVVVEAEDLVGNVSSEIFHVYLDTSTPSLSQLTSFVTDDSSVVPTYDAETGYVDYGDEAAETVSLNAAACAETCPPFAKFAPLMFEDAANPPSSPTAITFSFKLSDPCPTGSIKPTLTVQPAWYAGETLLHQPAPISADCGGTVVGISLQLPVDDDGVGSFPDGLVPDRLVVTAGDLGGQSVALELLLAVDVLPPPLFVVEAGAGQPEDLLDLLLAPTKPALDVAVNDGGVHRRVEVVNPTMVPAKVTLAQLPVESLLISHTRLYVQPDAPWGTSCAVGQCRYDGLDGDGTCGPPEVFATDTLYANAGHQARLRRTDNGVATFLNIGNSFALKAGESVVLDVVTGALESPLTLAPPVTVALADSSGHKVHMTGSPVARGACTWSADLPPDVTHYDIPDVVTSYSVKLASNAQVQFATVLDGVDGSLELPVTIDLESVAKVYLAPFALPTSAW